MSSFNTNQLLKKVKPSPIRSFNDEISSIDGLLRLTLGEPDFPTPDLIRQASVEAINTKNNGYTHSAGMIELRQVISDYLKRRHNLTYDGQDEIVVTVGATEAIFSSLFTLVNPGDKVAAPAPYYAVYKTQVELVGGEFIPIDVTGNGLKLTASQLEEVLSEHPDLKVLMINLPANPTGKSYSKEELEEIAQVARDNDLLVLSDEIYSELTYNQKHVSLASLIPERTLLVNGASKSHSMTGWRMGFVAGPSDLISDLFKIHQAMVSTPSTQAQYAAIAAYSVEGDAEIEKMRLQYQERRDYSLERLQDLGFQVETPEGAFYVFPQVAEWFDGSSYDFCLTLAKEAKVGTVPGSAFGQAGEGYFRISYAASMEDLEEAFDRIEKFVKDKQ